MPVSEAAVRGIDLEQRILRGLDLGVDLVAQRLGRRLGRAAPHLATGLRGEEEALFHLRQRGYLILARRWKTPKVLGDVDLIGWDGETLCFIEVKTRTGRDIVPAEFAVDEKKQKMLRSMASVYRRRFPEPVRRQIPIRFDVVSVYLAAKDRSGVEIDLFPGAFDR